MERKSGLHTNADLQHIMVCTVLNDDFDIYFTTLSSKSCILFC